MHFRLATAACLSLAAFGCSATVSPNGDAADAEASASTAAVIVVERSDGARSEATARFMRMHAKATTDEALRVVGATVDFPALGTCLSLATLASPGGAGDPAPSVQLVHVGAVSMEANGVTTSLLARQVPDVVDLVSGVVYARATDADLLPAQARYVLNVSGASDAEPFTVSATAPSDLGELRIASQAAGARALSLGAGAVDLTWEPGAADDMIYVDIAATDAARMPTVVRCAFADSGKASLAAALVPDEGTLSVHRLHRERFRARGIDSGEMRFDFAKVLAFTHR